MFLDNASTTPKPRSVIDAVVGYYEGATANVHRGVHALGEEATRLFDDARRDVATLIGAVPAEIVLVRGTTEAINFVANGLQLGPEDEVVFRVDGVVVSSRPVAISRTMRPVVSDFSAGGAAVVIDRLHASPYAPSGTFTSPPLMP